MLGISAQRPDDSSRHELSNSRAGARDPAGYSASPVVDRNGTGRVERLCGRNSSVALFPPNRLQMPKTFSRIPNHFCPRIRILQPIGSTGPAVAAESDRLHGCGRGLSRGRRLATENVADFKPFVALGLELASD